MSDYDHAKNIVVDYVNNQLNNDRAVYVSSIFENVPRSLPAVYVREIGHDRDERYINTLYSDQQYISTIEIQVFSAEKDNALGDAERLMKTAEKAMNDLRYIEYSRSQIDNIDRTVARIVARFRRVITGADKLPPAGITRYLDQVINTGAILGDEANANSADSAPDESDEGTQMESDAVPLSRITEKSLSQSGAELKNTQISETIKPENTSENEGVLLGGQAQSANSSAVNAKSANQIDVGDRFTGNVDDVKSDLVFDGSMLLSSSEANSRKTVRDSVFSGTLLGEKESGAKTEVVVSSAAEAIYSGNIANGDVRNARTSDLDGEIMIGSVTSVSEEGNYLLFLSQSPFTLSVYNATKNWDGSLYYSTDKTTWTEWNASNAVETGEENKIYLRGTNNTYITGASDITKRFVISGENVFCYGNIANLLDWQSVAQGVVPPMADYAFARLFYNCTSLKKCPELLSTTMRPYCYSYLFQNCTGLERPPMLPALTMAEGCYLGMFNGCSALKEAPQLPATVLAARCYELMFQGCASIITPPSLPAKTIPAGSQSLGIFYSGPYVSMFQNCTSLEYLPLLHATTIYQYGCAMMFYGCSKINISATKTGQYQYNYRLPFTAGSYVGTGAFDQMFSSTGGTFVGTPTANTTYYTDHEPIG